MNKAFFIGRLTSNPELRQTSANKNYTLFTVAVNDYRPGEQSRTIFIPCTAWNQTAVNMTKYLAKGSQVGVEAAISSYKSQKTGYNAISFSVVNLQYLDRKNDRPEQQTEQQSQSTPTSNQQPESPSMKKYQYEDLNDDNDGVIWED